MKAAIFAEPGRTVIDDRSIPDIGPTDALVRITTTTMGQRVIVARTP